MVVSPDPGPAEPAGAELDVEVRAGGGVVVRGDAGPRVALVHRPRYDDWTFPKGKCDRGESYADAARREVAEETGLHCELGAELGDTRYRDGRGRAKLVRYWLMDAPDDAAAAIARSVPNAEVDELRWISPTEAARLLTYEHDRELLGRLPHHLEGGRTHDGPVGGSQVGGKPVRW